MPPAFRITRSRILIDALLDIAELRQNPTLATTLRAIHAELVQASDSLAAGRVGPARACGLPDVRSAVVGAALPPKREAAAVCCDDCRLDLEPGLTLRAAFACPRFGKPRRGVEGPCASFVAKT
jgi:hypothetical protein